jgi:hypothetical protein
MKKLSRRRMMTVLAAAAAGAVAFGAGAFGLRRRADEAEPIRETEREAPNRRRISRSVAPATHSVKRLGAGRSAS